MGGKSSRNKGQSGERELAKVLGEALGVDLARNLDQTRDGGFYLLGLPGIALEVKRQEKVNLRPWWEQACGQARGPAVPVLAYRVNRQPWRFLVPLVDMGVATDDLEERSWSLAYTAQLSLEGFVCWYRYR